MAFSAAAVANRFLFLARRDGKDITPLKMQKLVYFAHGWYLALFGEPLIAETIQAWKYGPVIGSLYRILKHYGDSPIERQVRVITQDGYLPARLDRESLSKEEVKNARAVISRVWEQYGKFSASQLTTLTHSPDAPWSKIPNKDKPETPIPNRLIAEYFRAQVAA
jgi:uncharacterized phage-associated protein